MDLTREQLYEMLWADGVGRTEKALGMKPAELKVICEKYQIPRPSSIYWNNLALGKPTEKTPLPSFEDNQPIHTEDFIKRQRTKKPKPESPKHAAEESPSKTAKGKYPPRELPIEEPPTIYDVPDKLFAKDPIILDTKAKLRELNSRKDNTWSKKNLYKNTPEKWLDINVYQEQEDRALRVFHTIWRAAESNGYHLYIKVNKGQYGTGCETYFQVRNHSIRVQMKEINRRIQDETSTWSSWKWTSSGKLKFLCDREMSTRRCSYESNERVAAQDTDHTRIEDKIEHIIAVLEDIADKRDKAEIERQLAEERRKQEEELKRQEEERKRQEAERLAKIEARRDEERGLMRELLFNADRVHVATIIREYVARFEAEMADKIDPEELHRHLQWMNDKADYIDPFIKRNDEWLLPSDVNQFIDPAITKTTEEHHTSYGSYGHSTETTYSYWQLKNMWGHRR